jgi:hypothetical protein
MTESRPQRGVKRAAIREPSVAFPEGVEAAVSLSVGLDANIGMATLPGIPTAPALARRSTCQGEEMAPEDSSDRIAADPRVWAPTRDEPARVTG